MLCTPLTRRYFQADGKIHSDLTEYSEAMRGVANEMKVPLIELQGDSIAYLDKIGEAEGNKLAITKKDEVRARRSSTRGRIWIWAEDYAPSGGSSRLTWARRFRR